MMWNKEKKMKIPKNQVVKIEKHVIKIEKYIIKIYLNTSKFCAFKSIPLTEEQVDQFYAELIDNNSVMEFGTFYFNKAVFHHAILETVIEKKIETVEVKEAV